MERIKKFREKHFLIAAVIALLGVILLLKLMLSICKVIFGFILRGIDYLIGNIVSGVILDKLIEGSEITSVKFINAVIFYFGICLFITITLLITTLIIIVLTELVDIGLNKLGYIILGKKHQKSLSYNRFQLWFIKCSADISFFLNWIRFDVFKIRYSHSANDTMLKQVRSLSIENIICVIKNLLRYFFCVTTIHLFIGVMTVFGYYRDVILGILENFRGVLIQNNITTSQFLDVFEILTIICLLGYILLDIRHKANGYSELRMERFKELIQMEEKLLYILGNISYSLDKNIEIITDRKQFILQNGASELCGKDCYIDKNNIKFEEKRDFCYEYSEDRFRPLSELEEMKEEFENLSDLEEEFKKSSLSYSNIYLIDHQAMLTRVVHFWIPGLEDKEYKKMKFFCQSSMRRWFENRFIKPTQYDENKKTYYSESRARESILDASVILDYELMRAFELELYLKKYERKMIKRFKKINKFSRFNLN